MSQRNRIFNAEKKKVFLMSQQIGFQCRKNEIFNAAKKAYFYVAKN